MTAKLATRDDRIWAGVGEAGALRDGSILPHSTSDKQRLASLQFGCGYLSPYFVTDPERMEVVFEDAYILIHEKRLSSKDDLIPILKQITKSGKPLVIIAGDVGGGALAALVVNKLRGPLRVAAVRSPGSKDQGKRMLQDVARLTGGRAITEDLDIQLGNVQIPTSVRPRRSPSTRTRRWSKAGSSSPDFLLSLNPAPTQMLIFHLSKISRTLIILGTHGILPG